MSTILEEYLELFSLAGDFLKLGKNVRDLSFSFIFFPDCTMVGGGRSLSSLTLKHFC